MHIQLRTKGKVYRIEQPCSLEVLDGRGALVAVLQQQNNDAAQILTPGDTRFDTYARMNRLAPSTDVVEHGLDPTSGLLQNQRI